MDYKNKLRLALLQLQEYSDNELIVIEGETLNIQDTLDEIENTKYLSEQDEAKRTLTENGYYADVLWSVDDVKGKFDCTDAEALDVLDQALENNATMEQIWYAIDFHGEEMGLTKIED